MNCRNGVSSLPEVSTRQPLFTMLKTLALNTFMAAGRVALPSPATVPNANNALANGGQRNGWPDQAGPRAVLACRNLAIDKCDLVASTGCFLQRHAWHLVNFQCCWRGSKLGFYLHAYQSLKSDFWVD